MILSGEEVDALRKSLSAVCRHQDLIRATEALIEDKLKAQKPVFYADKLAVGSIKRDASMWECGLGVRNERTKIDSDIPLYTAPMPPDDDVVRDVARYRFLRDEAYLVNPVVAVVWKKNDDREECEWVNTVNGYSLDCHIDKAMGKSNERTKRSTTDAND